MLYVYLWALYTLLAISSLTKKSKLFNCAVKKFEISRIIYLNKISKMRYSPLFKKYPPPSDKNIGNFVCKNGLHNFSFFVVENNQGYYLGLRNMFLHRYNFSSSKYHNKNTGLLDIYSQRNS